MPPKMQAGASATALALQIDKNATRVFVGGLRKTTTEDRIFAHFAKFGSVKQVELKRQPNGESRGFAFVKFMDLETVDKVMEARTQHMIDNKWVDVKRHDNNASSSAPASVVAWGAKATGTGAVAGAAYAEEDEEEVRQDEDKMAAQSMLQAAFANEMSAMQATQHVQHAQQANDTSAAMGAASATPTGGMAAGMGAGMAMGGGMMPMGMMPMGMMPMGNGAMGMVMMPMMPGMMGMMNPAMMGMMNPGMMGTQGVQQGAQSPAGDGGNVNGSGCGPGGVVEGQVAIGGCGVIEDTSNTSSDFGPATSRAVPDRPSPY